MGRGGVFRMQKIHTIMLFQVEGGLCRNPFFAIEKRQVFLKLWFQVISIFEKIIGVYAECSP